MQAGARHGGQDPGLGWDPRAGRRRGYWEKEEDLGGWEGTSWVLGQESRGWAA